jgi:glutaredoxin
MKETIRMYTTSWCPDCHRAKRFFKDHGIAYEDIDIERNADAMALVMQHNEGRRRVPTLVVEGRYYGNPPLSELGKLVGIS